MSAPPLSKKTVTAIVIGNAFEWYDFTVYSFMTVFIAKLFFPHVNSLLAATASFGVAFVMRPLGGLFLGYYADKRGRRAAITLIITLMTLAVLMMAAAPTYAAAGAVSTVIIVIARLMQGFSAGGEFGTSTAILTELSPPHLRGFYCSWQMVGQTCAMLLGAVIGALMTQSLSDQQLTHWGWRVPFIFGLLLAPIGLYLRWHLHQLPLQVSESAQPFVATVKQHVPHMIIAMGLVVGATVATYINLSHMPTYAYVHLHLGMYESFGCVAIGLCVTIFLIPVFGWLSDCIGRKPILIASMTIYLIIIYPLFAWLLSEPSFFRLLMMQLVVCALLGAYFGAFAATLSELFPRQIRSTSLSISYNSAIMLFGGFAQFIVTYLIQWTGTPLAVTYYLMMAMSISLAAAICYKQPGWQYEHTDLAVASDRV